MRAGQLLTRRKPNNRKGNEMAIEVEITGQQRRILQSLFDQADEAAKEGKPGMVIAQVAPNGMRAGFIPHEVAKKFMVAVNPNADTDKRMTKIENPISLGPWGEFA